MPLSSICHARPSSGIDSRSAIAAPRVRSASASSAELRSPGTVRSRVSVCVSSSRSPSSSPRSAPRSCARAVIASASAAWPRITASSRSNTRPRSASPSMSATTAAEITPAAPPVASAGSAPRAIAWSSSDSPSRTEPSAARATASSASGATATPSFAAIPAKCPASSATDTRRRSNLWHRLSTVTGTLRSSVVAKMKVTCGGGSSSVLSSALNALRDSMWTSSTMNTFARACIGRKRVASMISRTSSTPVREAASISITSGCRSARIAVQFAHTPHGSAVGPPVPSGPTQHRQRAMIRAVVVLPTPRTPVSMNACATRPSANARRRMRTAASCPIRSSKPAGRYLRASTRYGAAGPGATAGASPNSPGPSGAGGRSSSRVSDISGAGRASAGASGARADVARVRGGAEVRWEAERSTRAETRCGCFLPDLTGLARRPSAADLPRAG